MGFLANSCSLGRSAKMNLAVNRQYGSARFEFVSACGVPVWRSWFGWAIRLASMARVSPSDRRIAGSCHELLGLSSGD